MDTSVIKTKEMHIFRVPKDKRTKLYSQFEAKDLAPSHNQSISTCTTSTDGFRGIGAGSAI